MLEGASHNYEISLIKNNLNCFFLKCFSKRIVWHKHWFIESNFLHTVLLQFYYYYEYQIIIHYVVMKNSNKENFDKGKLTA